MDPQTPNRDALLDDPRFWCLLYEPWLLAYVGDPFTEGQEYFFSLPQSAVDEFFRELEKMVVDGMREYTLPSANGKTYLHSFPVVSVLVSLANGWHAGVDLVMCPGDFGIDYVVVPPSGKPLVIGVHGGNHWLPALRWEELLLLANAARTASTVSRTRAVLLFYPACYPDAAQKDEVREVLRQAWGDVGFPVQHLEAWIDRLTDQFCAGHKWRRDPTHGWICEGGGSLRDPKLVGQHHKVAAGVFSAVAQLFSSLEGGGRHWGSFRR
jgi:hypothetical protein